MKIMKEQKHSIPKKQETIVDQTLFESLRECRMELAKKAHVPPYIIFSDKTLHDMSVKQPVNKEEMLMISGVGEVKYQRYGKAFLGVIQQYKTKQVP